MTVNDWVKVVHGNAVNKGFWESGTNLSAEQKLSKHMLMVGELAEASESVRNAELPYFLNGEADILRFTHFSRRKTMLYLVPRVNHDAIRAVAYHCITANV